MQEHEYIYEHGLAEIRGYSGVQGFEALEDQAEQGSELTDALHDQELVSSEQARLAEELADLRDQRATVRLGRGLALALVLSFLACLSALWLSGTLISAPDQVVPVGYLQMLADNRVLVLCVPFALLVICYVALRSLTREIMVGPVNRLDERQQTLRSQAQATAFKIIKYASVLIPVGFVLPHLPWFNPGTPVAPVGGVPPNFPFGGDGYIYSVDGNPVEWFHHGHHIDQITYVVNYGSFPSAPLLQPASSLEVALAGGLLLVGLFLMFTALPMAALAWKGKA